ncbi:hypothetical protein GW17_00026591 [Ensete ventricosum]|nr:hypothetical protein GW17_00026591 [Ensete ventricosum]
MDNNCRGRSNLQSFLDSTTPSVPSHKLPKVSLLLPPLISILHRLLLFISASSLPLLLPLSIADSKCSYPIKLRYQTIHLDNHIATLRPANRVRLHYILYCINNNVRENSGNKSSGDSEYKKLAGLDAASQGFDLGRENAWRTSEHTRQLYFEFFESCSPYGRIPLLDKVGCVLELFLHQHICDFMLPCFLFRLVGT